MCRRCNYVNKVKGDEMQYRLVEIPKEKKIEKNAAAADFPHQT